MRISRLPSRLVCSIDCTLQSEEGRSFLVGPAACLLLGKASGCSYGRAGSLVAGRAPEHPPARDYQAVPNKGNVMERISGERPSCRITWRVDHCRSGLSGQACFWHLDTRQIELKSMPQDGVAGPAVRMIPVANTPCLRETSPRALSQSLLCHTKYASLISYTRHFTLQTVW